MLLIGYLYGITSERRLAQEVSLHLAYRWFLGYDFDVSTPDHSVLSKARTRLASPLGKQRLAERQAYAEGPFGLAKELHGLRGTRFRGRRKVQIQLWLTAAAMNIKKAVRSTAASPELGGLPLLLASLAAFLSLGRWSLAPRAAEN